MSDLPSLSHLSALTDDTGVLQHAIGPIPNRAFGYCTDDIARALAVTATRLQLDPLDANADLILRTSLAYLAHAILPSGDFHNFMSHERAWLDEVGTEDSFGRAVYGLGIAVAQVANDDVRAVAHRLLVSALPNIGNLRYLRAFAYAGTGASWAYASIPEAAAPMAAARDALLGAYASERSAQWDWFEPQLTYDNARLPEALLRIGRSLGDRHAIDIGLRTLAFLREIVIEDNVFVPIGNDGWYPRGGVRARYAQQPLEATAMVEAQLAAYAVTRDPKDYELAKTVHGWFAGQNSAGLILARGGGCCDGLGADSVNPNMGAESTLAYLMSAYALSLASPPPA
ncbi:MAG: hypothetical protein ACYDA1_05920 [Vulcanimicrobiaceae bacterium]